uniref:E3 ubiquitin-protein ligase lubel-like n=1 Tax=Erigeron canadensis TaxID=72917 RepID=UPI001CB8EEA7|nr:E3 ubiquitin-protein ligase lubel-like [Erigeron canadensis]
MKTCSSLNDQMIYMVYFKGLVSDEIVMNVKMSFAGIGVAICDPNGSCVFELPKSFLLEAGYRGSESDVVELNALIEALNAADDLGLKCVRVIFDSSLVNQYLTGKQQPTNKKIVRLVDQLNIIKRKFSYFDLFLVSDQNYVKFAYKLAKDAIRSEATNWADNASGETILLEQCTICFEYVDNGQMLSVNKCLHRYCFSCMRKHVEAKLLQGKLPECPYEKCKSELEIESCKKFLTSELYDIMSLRIKEASIPPEQKVYCPFSTCSHLMSKTEVQQYTATSSTATQGNGMIKCVKCNRLFCINCKVPWHDNITCSDYIQSFLYQSSNEGKLRSLASQNRWRQCVKCSNLVELAAGCYHIYCRCGYEFCYICGSQYINKTPTCKCPLWDEHYIIYAAQNMHQNG